jgi:two-component system, chemotaxis family, sensor kinase CheA
MYHTTSGLGDPSAYRAIFFEETQEHLASVEAILLRMAPDQPCIDELNAIFRAVHSIKGSAAMLGCSDMAALAHLQENLLDLLRKEERPLEPADVQALLKAGDVVRAQALCHRGVADQAPDSTAVEALLREQLARPRTGAGQATAGPVVRSFAVRLWPLREPIPQEELEMMLAGLSEMGSVGNRALENVAGGSVSFEVQLEGTAADLQSVLSLLVAPELISIEKIEDGARLSPAHWTTPDAVSVPVLHEHDEFFVDPDEFRRKRNSLASPPAAQEDASAEPSPGEWAGSGRAAAEAAAEQAIVQMPDTGHIRVATEKIDLLVNLVGELVITEAMLARFGRTEDTGAGDRLLESGLGDLSRHTRNLQEAVLAIRMLPISNAFARFPRLVHELSSRLGKRVELQFEGEATEVDRGLIEKITDPLTHLVRNAIDHGLETPQVREAAGKPPVGSLRLQARQRGGNIVIEVSDDGRGLDRERILTQADRRGIAIAPDASDAQVWDLVFEPGLTTAQEVTDLSGRGVGMDVVRRNIKALGGTVEVSSAAGWGTSVTVRVPLTLAIIEAMIVAVGDATYVLPLATVMESLSLEPGEVHALPGQGDTLRVRDTYLPVLRLADLFPPRTASERPGGIAVIIEADGTHAALVVDEVIGQQQVVVKSLEANFRKVPGLSGATVMGDGSVALILDVAHIVRMS